MIIRHTLSAALLLACAGLEGCTALSKMTQVMLDPSIPVGAPSDQPSLLSLSLYASPTLNLNPSSTVGRALSMAPDGSPLAVSIDASNPIELTDKLQALLDSLREEHPARSNLEFDQATMPAMSSFTEIGSYRDQSVHMTFAEHTPSPEQVTTPIAFQILQLKDDSMLLTASYQALAQDLEKTLGSTLLQVDDYRLMPGQFKFIDPQEIDKATRYIAVIAHYHGDDGIDWKRVLPIAPRGHRHAVLVQFEESGVLLKGQG